MQRRTARRTLILALLGGLLAVSAVEAQDELFVTNISNSSVTIYGRTANGSTAPLRTIQFSP